MCIRDSIIYHRGCAPICGAMGMISVLVFTAAFVVQIAVYARMEDVDVLFNEASCVGDADVCSQAYRARRFYASNGSPAVLWACAAGLTLFAFPYDRRCRSRRDYFAAREDPTGRRVATASGWVAIVASLVALACAHETTYALDAAGSVWWWGAGWCDAVGASARVRCGENADGVRGLLATKNIASGERVLAVAVPERALVDDPSDSTRTWSRQLARRVVETRRDAGGTGGDDDDEAREELSLIHI